MDNNNNGVYHTQETDNTQQPSQVGSVPPNNNIIPSNTAIVSTSKKPPFVYLIAGLAILAAIVAIGLVALVSSHRKDLPKSNVAGQLTNTYSFKNPPCFLRLNKIICVEGQQQIRYDIPSFGENYLVALITPSLDGSKFLAEIYNASESKLVVLDDTLNIINQIKLDNNYNFLTGSYSFSNENNSILIGLYDSRDSSNGIYRYNLSTNQLVRTIPNLEQLGTVAQLSNGGILYQSNNGKNATPTLANADGSNSKKINFGDYDINYPVYFAYDQNSKVVLLLGTKNGKYLISTITEDDLLKGETPKTINYPISDNFLLSGSYVDGNVIAQGTNKAIVISKDGTKLGEIDKVDISLGILKTSKFKKSSSQTEQAADKIIGYSLVDEGLQKLLLAKVNNNTCTQDSLTASYVIFVDRYIQQKFANTIESCNLSASFNFYKKEAGQWITTDIESSTSARCDEVNRYKYTKEIIKFCYDNTGNIIDNVNP